MPVKNPNEYLLSECYPDDGQRVKWRWKGCSTYQIGFWKRGTRTIYRDQECTKVAAATNRIGGWLSADDK